METILDLLLKKLDYNIKNDPLDFYCTEYGKGYKDALKDIKRDIELNLKRLEKDFLLIQPFSLN